MYLEVMRSIAEPKHEADMVKVCIVMLPYQIIESRSLPSDHKELYHQVQFLKVPIVDHKNFVVQS